MSVATTAADISTATASTELGAETLPDDTTVPPARRFPIEDARCATHPVDLEWVPDHERAVVPPQLARLCRRCDGRASCLLWALASDEKGYWAGTTTADREQLRELGHDSVPAADWLQDGVRRRTNAGALHPEGQGSLSMYRRKCPCDECKAANAAERAAERSRAKARAAA